VPAVKVKVVLLIVAGFIAALKVAVTPVAQMPVAPLSGVSEITAGAAKAGLGPGLQQPTLKMSGRNAISQILGLLYLRMTVILLPLGFTEPASRLWQLQGLSTLEKFNGVAGNRRVQNCSHR
jgi:hypothetical protein